MRLSISEARARLTELAQLVMDSPGTKVIIEHRNREERIVLVAESHIRALEVMVEKLRESNAATPFKLAGSISSELTDQEMEAALAELRAAAASQADRRIAGLDSGPA